MYKNVLNIFLRHVTGVAYHIVKLFSTIFIQYTHIIIRQGIHILTHFKKERKKAKIKERNPHHWIVGGHSKIQS